jgi:hypothetical protein
MLTGKRTESELVITEIPTPFIVNDYFPNRNLLSVGGSLSAVAFNERLTCTLYYNGAFDKKHSDNGVGGQLSLGF